jgi:uncharacterized protein YceH (UPF0502 family)
MFDFGSPHALEEKLQTLCAKTKPLVIHIPRQVGQREDRYTHLLCGQPDFSAIATQLASKPAGGESRAEQEEKILVLESRILRLEKQVAALMDLNGIHDDDIK